MSETPTDEPGRNASRPTPLGIYDRREITGVTGIEVTAVLLSVLWLLGAGIYFLLLPGGSDPGNAETLRFMMTAMTIFMPVAMIWVAATAARSSRVMREESQRLQSAIDAIRQAYIVQSQSGGVASDSAVARKLEEIVAATRKTESALALFAATRAAPAPPVSATLSPPSPSPPSASHSPSPSPSTPEQENTPEPGFAEDQPALALGRSVADLAPPLPSADLVRALNFPDNSEDREGFAALRRALKDRTAGQLIQAAQDVLTLLSHDGIYMDDLRPDRARPEIWRKFAQGARGRSVSALGGIRDRASLALASERMKQDPIFRDAAHHFLRRFDRTFADFEPNATDAEISALADTRTARAFMFLGRAAGTFD